MTDLIRLSAADLADKLAAGEVSSVEATQAHLDRIADVDADVHAFLHVSEHALDVAADIDRRRAAGEALGALAGVPLAIKDVLVTTDMPSTSGSKILEGYMSPFDATVVARARAPRASCRSARRTWTSSRWARPPSTRPTVRPTTRGTSRASPAVRAAVPPRRSRRSRRRSPSDPTRAGRSASPRTSPAPSASSRPTAASAATARSRSPRASTRSAPSRARCSMRASCTTSSADTTRTTRRR